MDQKRFDYVARALAGGASRRQIVKSLAGGTAGAMTALAGMRGSFAKGKPPACLGDALPCREDSQCCSGSCCTGYCCGNTCCNDHCTVTLDDPYNCGACGHECGADQECSNSQCCQAGHATCSTDADCCVNSCVDGLCCLPTGGICHSGADCCSNYCNIFSEDVVGECW